jgi:hypothetical protein
MFASFEVKSLPGGFRKFDAESRVADGHYFRSPFTPANAVLRNEGRDMILKAKKQLDQKSSSGHSKNVFLIAHSFDYLTMEFQEPLIGHLLEPLDDIIEGVDSVWILWAPLGHFVVWSVEDRQWTNVLVGCIDPGDVPPDFDEELDVFQQIDLEFLKQTNSPNSSPYGFGLTVADEDN